MPGTRVLAALVAMAALWACAAPAVAAGPGTTSLLSRPSGLGSLPVAGDGGSGAGTEAMSGDGRFVVFLSGADDLGVRDTSFHVWVRDTAFDTNRLVDRAPGGEPANGFAQRASISRDGSTVCFLSNATNLVPGVSGGHVYVVTLSSGAVTVADRADTAVGAVGNDVPLGCALDATGAHVAFESRATNLVSGDTNSQGDVFVRDLVASTTERVSVDSGEAQAPQRSEGGAITADGLKVAFISQSPLVAGDTNEVQDVFLRDIAAGTTTRVSVATGSIQANGHSFSPSISDDGTTVAFASDADNLHLAPDTNDKRDVFVRLIGSDTTVAVSRADGPVGALGDGDSDNPAISGNGGGVAFDSEATNLGAGAPPPGVRRRVYLRQVGGDQHTLLLSRASGAAGAPSDGFAVLPSLPTTPTAAAWLDFGGNLDPAASGEFGGVFKRELSGGEPTILVSRPNGTGPRSSAVNTAFVAGPRAVSADGRRVVIVSHSDSLDPAGAGRFQHIYVRDTLTQTTTLVDRGSGPDAAAGNAGAQQASISADGRRVAFISEATNLLPGGNPPGAFVRDLETNELFLVSRQDGAAGAPLDLQISGGMEPAMNSDGTRVAFVSDLKPVGPADTNTDQDVHVRDLVAGTTTLVSVGPTGVGNSRSTNPAMSADGTRVAFQSNSSNLVGEPVTPGAHIYVRDLGAGTTVLADRSSADGAPGTGQAIAPGISADGTRVMFTALQPLTPEALPAPGRAIYVRDLTTQTTILASRGDGASAPAVSTNGGGSLSHDGGRVSFTASGPELPGAPGPQQSQVYVRDLAAQTTTLASAADGTAATIANAFTSGSALSADGGCVAFGSPADNLTEPNYETRDFSQVYLRVVSGECPKQAPGGSPPAALDRDAPAFIGRLVLSNRIFKAAARGRSAIPAQRRRRPRRIPTGTRVTFRLDEAATVAFRVERAKAGRRVGRRCVKPTRRNQGRRRCTRYVRVRGAFTVAGAAGRTRFRFTGRLRGRKLRPGRYRLVAVATDVAGNRSGARRARFKVVRR